MTQAATEKSALSPPIAPRRPHVFTTHGITVTDDYAWLKDAKWQDVLRDPSILDPDIRKYLEAENDYTESLLGHTTPLQKKLVAEMRGRIKEDDFSVPAPDGPFAYLRKFREGGQHELFGRTPRDGGEVQIVLDGDALAANHEYFKFGGARHSDDHKLQAWSADTKGSEYFSIRVRDWADGKDRDDLVEETDGGIVWSKDCNSFFYVKLDDNHRPMQVWRHRLGTKQADDTLVYEEADSGWFTHLHESSSGRFCVIAGGDHETSEQRLIDLARPEAPPRLVAAREEGVQYSLADRGEELFILTNADGAIDFKVVTAPLATPERANWRDLIPYREGVYVLDVELYAGHMVRLERANALPAIIIRDLKTGEEHAIAFDEAAYSLDTMGSYEFETTNLRFSYSSMTTPAEVYDYDMATRAQILRKRQEIRPATTPPTTSLHASWRPRMTARWCRSRSCTARTWCATARRRCCSMATAPTAWRCLRPFPPTGCRWSIAVLSTRSRISAAAPTRAGAGISTASARRRRTRSMISPRQARADRGEVHEC